jgi:hypothetical protein
MKDFCVIIMTIDNNKILYKTLNSIDKYFNNIDIYLMDNSINPEKFEYKSVKNKIFYYNTKIGYIGVAGSKKKVLQILNNKLLNYRCTFIKDDDCLVTKSDVYNVMTKLLLKNQDWGMVGSIGEKRGWLINDIKENPKCVIPTHVIGTIMVFKTDLLLKIDWDENMKAADDHDSTLQILKMNYKAGLVDVGTKHKRSRRLEKEFGDNIWEKDKIIMARRNSEILKPNSFINKNTPKTLFLKNKYYYTDDYQIHQVITKIDENKLF